MSYLQFITAFLLLAGIALLWAHLLRLAGGEGMVLAVASVVGILWLSGALGTFRIGQAALAAAGIGGWLWHLILSAGRDARRRRVLARSPYLAASAGLTLFFLVVYRNDRIQHIDEFHQWASAVRYMLRQDALPFGQGVLDANQLIGTSFFHLFFQEFTGYQEAFMYVSASLLIYLGLLLPFANAADEGRADRAFACRKTALYVLLTYLAIFTFYLYGIKNMYVDMPCAAFAGGLAGWWTTRKRGRRANWAVLLCGMALVLVFKSWVGLLLDLFLAAFVFLWTWIAEGKYGSLDQEGKKRFGRRLRLAVLAAALLALLALAACLLIPRAREAVRLAFWERRSLVGLNVTKVKKTIVRLVSAVFGKPLTSRGRLTPSFAAGLGLVMLLFAAAGDLSGQKRRKRLCLWYSAVTALFYLGFILTAFLALFSYEESVKVAGVSRYFSTLLIYLLVIALTLLFGCWTQREERRDRIARYTALILTVALGFGMDESFIPSMTGIDKTKISGYSDLNRTRKQLKNIQAWITEKDRVYLLNQLGETEYPVNLAHYELEEQVSNYLEEPWKFTQEGCVIRVQAFDSPTLSQLPALLQGGGYTYLWIYTTDEYLTRELPEVMEMSGAVEDGQLYRVLRDREGNVTALALAQDLP